MLDERIYQNYIGILKEEMIPAMGCTEPIALAYGAARAREVLGKEPEHITAKCSGNIIKNVRCVIIPNRSTSHKVNRVIHFHFFKCINISKGIRVPVDHNRESKHHETNLQDNQ